MKFVLPLIAAASLFGAAPAAALDIYSNGEHTRVFCSGTGHSTSCYVWRGPMGSNNARVIQVPPDSTPPNINDTWGDGCRSCVDLAKPIAPMEAGR